jgi:hypothetical protein
MPPSDAHLHAVDPRAVQRRYRRGETLQHAGDCADVARIERGLVKLVAPAFDGRDRILAVLGAGDLLGAEAALGGRALAADAVALSAVATVACDRDAFLAGLRTDPGHDGRRVLSSGLNHQAWASLIGAQRASVSVAMAEFRRARAAFGARGTYTIDLARLRPFAGADVGRAGDDVEGPTFGVRTTSASHTTTSTPSA